MQAGLRPGDARFESQLSVVQTDLPRTVRVSFAVPEVRAVRKGGAGLGTVAILNTATNADLRRAVAVELAPLSDATAGWATASAGPHTTATVHVTAATTAAHAAAGVGTLDAALHTRGDTVPASCRHHLLTDRGARRSVNETGRTRGEHITDVGACSAPAPITGSAITRIARIS